MRAIPFTILSVAALGSILGGHEAGARRNQTTPASRTQVVLLGTGTPRPLPHRSGPSTAVVVDDVPYLVDFGAGVVRRAAAAALDKKIAGLDVRRLETAFVTHLHSDHTVGYPDLIFTPWVMGRTRLRVYGPKGLAAMTEHVLKAWQADIEIRTGPGSGRKPVTVETHEITAGVVYQDDKVRVTALPVLHGDVPQAFGYAFKTPDRTIVISGDASPSPAVLDACRKCDVLIHEVYASGSMAPMPDWPAYRARHHTSTEELARIANQAQPALLVVYHVAQGQPNGTIPDDQVLREIQTRYKGKVVIGQDLDVF